MRCIAQETYPTVGPTLQRLAIQKRKFENLGRRRNQAFDVNESDVERTIGHFRDGGPVCLAIPALFGKDRGHAVSHIHHDRPIGQPCLVRACLRDRIENELGGHSPSNEHRSPIFPPGPVDCASPKQMSAPSGRLLGGIEQCPYCRTEPVRPDHIWSRLLERFPDALILEAGYYAVSLLLDVDKATAGAEPARSQPTPHFLKQDAKEPAPVDRNLRKIEASVEATRGAEMTCPDFVANMREPVLIPARS